MTENSKLPDGDPASDQAREWTKEERSAFYDDLWGLKASCGSNKHDQVIVLISVCIDRGINTQPHIIGVLRRLNFNAGHVVRMLNDGKGHRWTENPQGILSLLPECRH